MSRHKSIDVACLHEGIVVIRPHRMRERGILLSNVAETETRIRFLPGFVSATFFTSVDGTVVRLDRWASAAAADAAFTSRAFTENLSLTNVYAVETTTAIGSTTIFAGGGDNAAPSHAANSTGVIVLDTSRDQSSSMRAALERWAASFAGTGIDAVALIVDPGQRRIGVILAGYPPVLPDLPAEVAATVVERIGPLVRYCSVTRPDPDEARLDYVLSTIAFNP